MGEEEEIKEEDKRMRTRKRWDWTMRRQRIVVRKSRGRDEERRGQERRGDDMREKKRGE